MAQLLNLRRCCTAASATHHISHALSDWNCSWWCRDTQATAPF